MSTTTHHAAPTAHHSAPTVYPARLAQRPAAGILAASSSVLLREVNRTQGTSLLFITHDLGVVRQITERVLVLYRGEIVEQGATDVVLDAPEHDYTQRLVAAMPSTHVAQEA